MNYDLYVITDSILSRGRSHEEVASLAVDGGADVIQLRDKVCSTHALVLAGKRIREMTHRTGVLFMVNDRLDVAIACGADGVHLGQYDLPVATARTIAPRGFIIGVSVSSADEAKLAVTDGADYIAASPVFPTAQKAEAVHCCGLEGIRRIRAAVSIPLIAIGDIGMHNISDVVDAGADGVAVISAVVGQPDITAAARALKNRVLECKAQRRARIR
jgi:thiamine-phosphate pyrophosphorylase